MKRQVLLLLLLSFIFLGVAPGGADDARKKAGRSRFGSSLKRLKWDDKSKTAIDRDIPSKAGRPNRNITDDTIRLSAFLVVMDVLVTYGTTDRFVSGLSKDNFEVTEDGKPQKIQVFTLGNDASIKRSIILIIDRSGSQRACLEASIDAAKKLIDNLLPDDEMAIVTDDVELLADFTRNKQSLKEVLESIRNRANTKKSQGRSLNFTALLASLRELTRDETRRTIIIFQTDGDEAPTLRDQPDSALYEWNMPKREFGLADVFKEAVRSRATIYTVVPGSRLTGLDQRELYKRGRRLLEEIERMRFSTEEDYLKYIRGNPLSEAKVKLFSERFANGQAAAARVAEITGGWIEYLEKPEQAEDIYTHILQDINHRHIIGYYPSNTARDKTTRQVIVSVPHHPEYFVLGRKGYVAPPE